MAAVNVLLKELEPAVNFTCADGTGIEKGTLLQINTDMTVVASDGDTDEIIGIAAEEKIASDGNTQIGVYLRGVFRGTAGAAGVTVGKAIISDTGTGSVNELVVADVNSENVVGIALETATDLETFKFLLQPVAWKGA